MRHREFRGAILSPFWFLAFLSTFATAQDSRSAAREEALTMKPEVLQALAADDPDRVVQAVIDWSPSATLEDVAAVVFEHRIRSLYLFMKWHESPRSGRSVSVTFSADGPPRERQITRANCALLFPSTGTFTDAAADAVDKYGDRWRVDPALIYMNASAALSLVRASVKPVTRVTVVSDLPSQEQARRAIGAAIYSLSTVATARGVSVVEPPCSEFFRPVPPR